jgi:hypothetical protein
MSLGERKHVFPTKDSKTFILERVKPMNGKE